MSYGIQVWNEQSKLILDISYLPHHVIDVLTLPSSAGSKTYTLGSGRRLEISVLWFTVDDLPVSLSGNTVSWTGSGSGKQVYVWSTAL